MYMSWMCKKNIHKCNLHILEVFGACSFRFVVLIWLYIANRWFLFFWRVNMLGLQIQIYKSCVMLLWQPIKLCINKFLSLLDRSKSLLCINKHVMYHWTISQLQRKINMTTCTFYVSDVVCLHIHLTCFVQVSNTTMTMTHTHIGPLRHLRSNIIACAKNHVNRSKEYTMCQCFPFLNPKS